MVVSCRSCSGHSQDPPVEEECDNREREPADKNAGYLKSRTHQAERRGLAREHNDRGKDDADDALPDDQARRQKHAKLLRRFGLWSAISALVEEPADYRADDNHQRALRWQIDSETNSQRWNAHVFRGARKNFVQQNDANADQSADPDQAPVNVCGYNALSQRGNEPSLRRGQ